MHAHQKSLTEILFAENHQFTIPIYQRPYSWQKKQCEKLWQDIKNAGQNNCEHFIGSIVRFENSVEQEVSINTVIDGQQRITTILLLVSAMILAQQSKKRAIEWKECYLINRHKDSNLYYKILLTDKDKSSLINIIDNNNNKIESIRIKENFELFQELLKKIDDLETISTGIRNLKIVDVVLDLKHDDPQLIFESLNSTGLKLSQADLIRNFLLMKLPPQQQEKIYTKYWQSLEKNFRSSSKNSKDEDTIFNRFFRDYLTITKNGIIPNENNVYEEFKIYVENQQTDIEIIVEDIYKFSEFYTKIAYPREQENNFKLKQAFIDLNNIKVNVSYPFLMSVYDDFSNKIINEKTFLDVLKLVESYVFRRFICELATNSLNKTFANLHKSINKQKYFDSLQSKLISFKNNERFPRDEEFTEKLKLKNLYEVKHYKTYWILKFENFNRKETILIENYSIEHIMPQNNDDPTTLTSHWKEELGENYQQVWAKYLHTLGNLTLTAYNSELSNKSFIDKKIIFNQSPLKINESLRNFENWNENSINKRAEILITEMLKIWQYPKVDDDILNNFQTKSSRFDLASEDSFVHTKPLAIFFENEEIKLKDWKDFIIAICKFFNNLSPTEFNVIMQSLPKVFSFQQDKLRGAAEFDHNKYVQTHSSTDTKIENCKTICEKMNYDPEKIQFTVVAIKN
jgi:uncharacterized protein with ParB-like and HNH nuclease domain